MNVEEMARAKFDRKMSLPQYSEYIGNEDAQFILMEDCRREAMAEERGCGDYA